MGSKLIHSGRVGWAWFLQALGVPKILKKSSEFMILHAFNRSVALPSVISNRENIFCYTQQL